MTDAPELQIDPVQSPRDLKRFIRFPWEVYADDPAWVPPLLREQAKVFDRTRHPFHEHAQTEYFLARKGSRIVGRIAAILNHRHNDFHDERVGFFGFFETVDDQSVATALLSAAEGWLAAKGMEAVIGPMNFSTNDESHSPGILVHGFDKPPFVLMGHGRPYYPALVEGAGYGKAKDLYAYWLSSNQPPERIERAVGRIEAGIAGLRIRNIDVRKLQEEVGLIQEIYNSAWEKNWGFVPMTEKEIDNLAKDLQPILEPRYGFIATKHGEPVGFALTLPDFNRALVRLNGRLFPVGFLKLLWHSRRIDRVRVFALGLKQKVRGTGLDAVFYLRMFEAARELGHTTGESSWILEDNWKMRRALEKVGAELYKTYRVYQKILD